MFNCHINAQKISSPSVTKLVLVFCDFHPATRTHMSFPSLASLELKSCHGRAPFLESMPSLVEAIVRFDGYCADRCEKSAFGDCGDDSCEGCYGSRFDHTSCVCLKSLLEATHLELSAEVANYVFRRDLKLHLSYHTFAKLKTLLLGEWCVTPEFSELIWFLQNTLILERLTIQIPEAPKYSLDVDVSTPEWPFASRHLKVVEIECKEVNLWVCKCLMTLGRYGIAIERINIKRTSELYGYGCDTPVVFFI
uniref:FBD domain-containing protein n=1 Tax=Oryza brachyantha TaxID=4533 RepID=J3N6Q9_ORYBR